MGETAQHRQRVTRAGGRKTRSILLDHAARLFMAQGFAGVSLSEIAAAAGAFPSQISYYFKTKDALFVEAACRELLHLGQAAEDAAAGARGAAAYRDALIGAVAPAPALALMIEAMTLAGRRAELTAMIARTFQRLHEEGTRAYDDERARRGWTGGGDPRATSQRFWDLALGVSLRVAATGGGQDAAVAAMRQAMREELAGADVAGEAMGRKDRGGKDVGDKDKGGKDSGR